MLSLKTVWFCPRFRPSYKNNTSKPKSSAGHASHLGPEGCRMRPEATGLGITSVGASQTGLFPKPGSGAEPKSPPVPNWASPSHAPPATRVIPKPRFPSLKRSHKKKSSRRRGQLAARTLRGGRRAPPTPQIFLWDKRLPFALLKITP